ncbi:DDRGK domain-containing protein 1 [Hordeum vulgare subsp. vulgare]|uniref:DDRGK domain-containing protein 1 n=1 Tax=Hordeum vulgare subsp. vulgare TaxID=112509 RepID=A0A8I6XDG3_HORVV|nr:DDRGK domain-containing protein 1 [Hordeum vulgare subsp. vulgare]
MDGSGGILAAVVCALLVFAIFPLLLWRRRSDATGAGDNHRLPPQPLQGERVLRGGAPARRMRRRPAAASSSAASTSRDVAEDESGSDEEDPNVPKGSKKERKRQEREEREAQRQANEAARNSRRTNQDRYEEMRRKKDEEREAQERLLEEEAMARKAKEEEAAALEFEKWKGAFSVDAEGTTESETQDGGQGLLHNFVEYIKKQKCVPLEDLAGEFGMRTQDCINRIITLEGMDRLSGVMDDRGKFIYISIEEMQAVADYIRKHGRVSISHLANNSNEFIDLEPKPLYDEKEESHQDESAPAGIVAEP